MLWCSKKKPRKHEYSFATWRLLQIKLKTKKLVWSREVSVYLRWRQFNQHPLEHVVTRGWRDFNFEQQRLNHTSLSEVVSSDCNKKSIQLQPGDGDLLAALKWFFETNFPTLSDSIQTHTLIKLKSALYPIPVIDSRNVFSRRWEHHLQNVKFQLANTPSTCRKLLIICTIWGMSEPGKLMYFLACFRRFHVSFHL